jgi:hypothetical protein
MKMKKQPIYTCLYMEVNCTEPSLQLGFPAKVTNSVTYNGAELITTVKSFIAKDPD